MSELPPFPFAHLHGFRHAPSLSFPAVPFYPPPSYHFLYVPFAPEFDEPLLRAVLSASQHASELEFIRALDSNLVKRSHQNSTSESELDRATVRDGRRPRSRAVDHVQQAESNSTVPPERVLSSASAPPSHHASASEPRKTSSSKGIFRLRMCGGNPELVSSTQPLHATDCSSQRDKLSRDDHQRQKSGPPEDMHHLRKERSSSIRRGSAAAPPPPVDARRHRSRVHPVFCTEGEASKGGSYKTNASGSEKQTRPATTTRKKPTQARLKPLHVICSSENPRPLRSTRISSSKSHYRAPRMVDLSRTDDESSENPCSTRMSSSKKKSYYTAPRMVDLSRIDDSCDNNNQHATPIRKKKSIHEITVCGGDVMSSMQPAPTIKRKSSTMPRVKNTATASASAAAAHIGSSHNNVREAIAHCKKSFAQN